ncbi:DIMBOA UDP-glucosyltransferase BX8-like [Miscanthus floridulus]|uniref:DIMBOA UDP-glucosyltransferase BX8-like n=1 Tax=Miscanthus floridulus TaxID=154761 RepID=UPI00345A1646
MAAPPAPSIATDRKGAAAANHGHGRRHVLLFPFPYQGHIHPMFRLAGVLHRRGFAITVFHTHFNAPDPALHPDYRFVPVPDGMSCPPPVTIEDTFAQIISVGDACEAAFRDRLAAVLQEYSRDAVACLVADAHLLPVFKVATRLAVPTLALRTSSAACHACFLAYPMLCKKGYLPVQDSQLDLPVTELPPYRVRDLLHIGEAGHHLECQLVARAVAGVNISSGGSLEFDLF